MLFFSNNKKKKKRSMKLQWGKGHTKSLHPYSLLGKAGGNNSKISFVFLAVRMNLLNLLHSKIQGSQDKDANCAYLNFIVLGNCRQFKVHPAGPR